MFHSICHQRDANWNKLMSLHTYWNDPNLKCWPQQTLANVWGNGNSIHCWWECKTVPPLWKTVWLFITKLNAFVPCDIATVLLGFYWKDFKTCAIVVQLLSHVWLFATPWIATSKASLSFTISWSWFKFMSIEVVMPANHLILLPLSPLALHLYQHQGLF